MRAAPDHRLATARRLAGAGDADGALRLLKQILALSPANADALHLYAGVCMQAARHADAAEALRRAAEVAPKRPDILCDLATAVAQQGRHDEADDLLDRAVALAPNDPRILAPAAEHMLTTGRLDDAERLLAPHASSADVRLALTWSLVCARRGEPHRALSVLSPHAGDTRLTPAARRMVLFRLAGLYDAAGEYEDAFETARLANAFRNASFDAQTHRRSIDLLIDRWSPEAIDKLPVGDAGTQRPVFIVGLPRSGTSLVEQILASHPAVFGADERPEMTMVVERLAGSQMRTDVPHMHRLDAITPDMTKQAASAYLQVMRSLNADAQRVTDKRPDNFLHLGLVSRLFPNATVIHIERNPLDVATSCWFRDFYGPYPWAYDLEHIAAFIDDKRRLMAHWTATLDIDILSIRYEDLVDAPGIESHRLVHHIGLPWHDDCLRFHENRRVVRTSSNEQVRRPVHPRSVDRWRNYAPHLEALIERFGAGDDPGAGDIRAA